MLRARNGLDGYANLGVGFEVDRAVKPNHAAIVGTGQSHAHDRKYTFVEFHSGRLGPTASRETRRSPGRAVNQASAAQIDAFTKGLGRIVRAARKQTPPFVKIIRPSGTLTPLA